MSYRLLVDLEVLLKLQDMPKRTRVRLLEHIMKIQHSPDRFADYQEDDVAGRTCEVSLHAGFAIYYWIDFPDRHVKIMLLELAD